jgi:tetratricopeptide (TPR) repeat protein
MKGKAPIETKPLRPIKSAWDWIILIVPMLGACGILLALPLLDPSVRPHAFPLCFSGVVLAGILFQMRKAEPVAKLKGLLVTLSALIGFDAYLISGQSFFMLLGLGVTVAVIAWLFASAPPHFRAAFKRFQAGDMDGALQLVNQTIQARPNAWEAYQLRSLIHLYRTQITDAEQDARIALRLKPNAHLNHNTLGQVLLIQGRYAEAKESFVAAWRLAPDYAETHYNLGLAHYRLGEYADAVEALTIATKAGLPFVQYTFAAHYLLGQSLEALGLSSRAEAAYKSMTRFRGGLEKLIAEVCDKPDYPGIVAARADIADIERRLNSKQG